MSETKWFTKSLSEAEAMRHPAMGLGYLFGPADLPWPPN